MANGECVIGAENKTNIKNLKREILEVKDQENRLIKENSNNYQEILHNVIDIKSEIAAITERMGSFITVTEMMKGLKNFGEDADKRRKEHKKEVLDKLETTNTKLDDYVQVNADYKAHMDQGKLYRIAVWGVGIAVVGQFIVKAWGLL